jgi:hypothetical protein
MKKMVKTKPANDVGAPITVRTNNVEKDNVHEQTNDCANLITIERLNDCDDWFKIVMSLKSAGEQRKEIAKTVSQKSSKRNEDELNETWTTPSKNMSVATMHHHSKPSDEDRFIELQNDRTSPATHV